MKITACLLLTFLSLVSVGLGAHDKETLPSTAYRHTPEQISAVENFAAKLADGGVVDFKHEYTDKQSEEINRRESQSEEINRRESQPKSRPTVSVFAPNGRVAQILLHYDARIVKDQKVLYAEIVKRFGKPDNWSWLNYDDAGKSDCEWWFPSISRHIKLQDKSLSIESMTWEADLEAEKTKQTKDGLKNLGF